MTCLDSIDPPHDKKRTCSTSRVVFRRWRFPVGESRGFSDPRIVLSGDARIINCERQDNLVTRKLRLKPDTRSRRRRRLVSADRREPHNQVETPVTTRFRITGDCKRGEIYLCVARRNRIIRRQAINCRETCCSRPLIMESVI